MNCGPTALQASALPSELSRLDQKKILLLTGGSDYIISEMTFLVGGSYFVISKKNNFLFLTGGADYVISKLGYADFDRPESRPPKDEKQRALNDAVNMFQIIFFKNTFFITY